MNTKQTQISGTENHLRHKEALICHVKLLQKRKMFHMENS